MAINSSSLIRKDRRRRNVSYFYQYDMSKICRLVGLNNKVKKWLCEHRFYGDIKGNETAKIFIFRIG
jgi:hypothetical protein